jgi:hypothetical protein
MTDEATTEGQADTEASTEAQSEENLLTSGSPPTDDDLKTEDNPDGTEGEADEKTDGEGDSDDQKEDAPEEYSDFNLPEGFEALDENMLKEAAPLFKEAGLSQEQAQKFVDLYANTIKSQSESTSTAFTDVNNANKKAIMEHAEFGGNELKASLVHTARAIDEVMGDNAKDFKDLLDQSGLGNHPLMFELLTKVGKSIKEDGIVDGQKAVPKKDQATIMYGEDGTGVKTET